MRPLSSPPTLGGAVAEHLRTAIVAGEIPPGQLLKESELAQRLGVSATPIREALGELSDEGLVEIEQIGRAQDCTPVTNAHLVCRLLLEKNKIKHTFIITQIHTRTI